MTNNDTVYGFGSNYWGSIGLGHNMPVNSPQIITELCHKNIKQFINGRDFVLAVDCNNYIYGWGQNNVGQLGIEPMKK